MQGLAKRSGNQSKMNHGIQRTSIFVACVTFWFVLAGGFSFTLIEALLSFAYLVIVPLTLTLIKTEDRHGETFKSYKVAVKLWPFAAVLGSTAFIFTPGWASVMLSLVWLAYTLFVALYGFVRLAARGFYPLEETSIDIGLIYLTIGGAWQTIYHTGYDFMQFGSTIISLTAIHFHYSSFVVPIFAGLLGRVMSTEEQKQKGYKWLVLVLTISPMGIAIGITFSRWVEFLFVALFVLALWYYAWLVFTLKQLKLKELRKATWCLRSSALILLGTMLLSLLYGLGRILQISTVSIPNMVLLHGIGNAFGFILLGLIGWRLIQPEMKGQPYGVPFSQIRGKGRIGRDFLQRNGYIRAGMKEAKDQNTQKADGSGGHSGSIEQQVNGLVDDFQSYNRSDFNSAHIHPLIREFYEDTLSFELKSVTRWAKGFRFFSRIYAWFSQRAGQLHLFPNGAQDLVVDSQIVPVDDVQDGRRNVRAWIRTDRESQKTIFVALYSQHYNDQVQETYMNVGLPLPYSQMTGVLRLEHELVNRHERVSGKEVNEKVKKGSGTQGLILTSVPRHTKRGDEGIYLVTKWLTIRLPLNERFVVHATDDASKLQAFHQMWLFGYAFLTIHYEITCKRKEPLYGKQ